MTERGWFPKGPVAAPSFGIVASRPKPAPRDIRLRYSTIDRFSESKRFKTLDGARAYAKRRLGDCYDVSLAFNYAVSGDGVGKVSIAGGTSWKELLGYSEEGF